MTGVDNDCDGVVPEDERDQDGDGLSACQGDCDDDDADTYPGAPEVPGDGIDQDCDGNDLVDDADDDGDGLSNAEEAELGTDPNNPDTDERRRARTAPSRGW